MNSLFFLGLKKRRGMKKVFMVCFVRKTIHNPLVTFFHYFKWNCLGYWCQYILKQYLESYPHGKGGLWEASWGGRRTTLRLTNFLFANWGYLSKVKQTGPSKWSWFQNHGQLHIHHIFQLAFLIISSAAKYFQYRWDYLKLICPSSLSDWDLNMPS